MIKKSSSYKVVLNSKKKTKKTITNVSRRKCRSNKSIYKILSKRIKCHPKVKVKSIHNVDQATNHTEKGNPGKSQSKLQSE